MAKVKYKEKISPELEALVRPRDVPIRRLSVGKEELLGEYHYLPLESLIPYHKQARKKFDQEDLNELAHTIKVYGLRQPLTVMISKIEEGKYEIISGERRFKASKIAGLKRVPCIIAENEDEILDEIALIENVQRKDLHPIELALCLKNLNEEKEWGDVKALSQKLGMHYTKVSELLKLNILPENIKKILLDKNIKSRAILRSLVKCKDETEMFKILGFSTLSLNEIKPRSRNVIHITTKSGKLDFICDYKRLDEIQRQELKMQLQKIIEQL